MKQKKRTIVKLIVSKDILLTLMEKHGMSEAGVYNALSYKSNSEKAKAIRKSATDMGAAVQSTTYCE